MSAVGNDREEALDAAGHDLYDHSAPIEPDPAPAEYADTWGWPYPRRVRELPGGVTVRIRDSGLTLAWVPALILAVLLAPLAIQWAATHLPTNPAVTALLMAAVMAGGYAVARGRSWVREVVARLAAHLASARAA